MPNFYNTERKINYIGNRSGEQLEMLTKLFEFTEPFESFAKQDLGEWSIYKMSEALHKMDEELREFCFSHHAIVKYACASKERSDDIIKHSDEELFELRDFNGYVFSARHLEYLMNLIYDPIEKDSKDLICRGMMWLSYIGFSSIDQCLSVTIDDIDADIKYIYVKGHKIKIHPCSRDVFYKLIHLDAFKEYRNNPYRVNTNKRRDSKMLFRIGSRSNIEQSDETIKRNIRTLLTNRNIVSGVSLNMKKVRASAIYEKAYLEEIMGIRKVNFREELTLDSILSDTVLSNNVLKCRSQYLNKGYQDWKNHFIKDNNK